MNEERKAELRALLAELEEEGGRETKGSPSCMVCRVQNAPPDKVQVHVEVKSDVGEVKDPKLVVKEVEGDFVDEASLDDLSDQEWVGGAAFSLPPMPYRDSWPAEGAAEFFVQIETDEGELVLNGPYST